MARRGGLLCNRLNERTLLSWAQTNESLRTTDSSSPVIAVMQPAHALLANHGTLFQRACPASRRLLVQPEVGSVVVIIGNVLGEESLQMPLIQGDHCGQSLVAGWRNHPRPELHPCSEKGRCPAPSARCGWGRRRPTDLQRLGRGATLPRFDLPQTSPLPQSTPALSPKTPTNPSDEASEIPQPEPLMPSCTRLLC